MSVLQKGKLISCVQCADRVDAIGFSKENHLLISQRVFQQSLFSWQVMHPKSTWPDFNGDIRFQLCDIHTGRCLKTYGTERDFFKAMVISTNAKDSNVLPIFSAGVLFKSSRTCRFWLKGTRSTKDVIHPDVVTSMDFSPDEKCFATGCADHVVRIWNIDGALSKVFDGHVAAITTAKFSPSGDQLVSASEDRTIRLWNIETNDCIRIFTGHNNSVIHASFTNNGQQIISVSEDGTIRFWGVKTGAEIVRCYGFDDGNWVIVTPDGHYDSSNGGECPHLRWTVGMESYPVEKFKERYYTPGLLVKARKE